MDKTRHLSASILSYHKVLLVLIYSTILLSIAAVADAATITSNNVTGNWNAGSTWVGGNVPQPGDDVVINASATITVTADATCNSISWTGNPTATRTFTINSGVTLTVTGDITLAASTNNNRNRVIDVAGILDCGGSITMQTSGGDTRDIILNIQTGAVVTIAGNLIMTSAFLRHHVDMSGTAIINIGGNVGANATGTTAGGGFTTPTTINLNGAVAQSYFPATPGTAAEMKINNSSGVTFRIAIPVTILTIGDITTNSILDDNGFQVSSTTGTLNMNNGGKFRLGAGTATTFPAGFTTFNLDPGTTIEYKATVAQNVLRTVPYVNLTISGSTTKTVNSAGAMTIGGDLTIVNGTFTTGANNNTVSIGGDFSNSGTFTSGTGLYTFNGTTNQLITGTATFGGGLTINNTGAVNNNTVTLSNNVSVTGNLTITAGVYDLGSFTSNRSAAGGTMTISNGAKLMIGGTNTLPSNYTAHSIGATSTVEFDGTTNTVIAPNSSQAYGNLIISASGATTSASYSVAGTLTVTGSFIASAGTITMSTAASGIVNSGTLNFRGLTIAATPTVQTQYNASYNVAAVLTVNGGVTFAPSGGTITMNNAASSIVNSGTTTFNNLTISVTPTLQSQYNTSYSVDGTLTISGAITFAPTGGTITMSGSAGSISNASGTVTFSSLSITGTTVSSTGNFAVGVTMDVSGVFNPSATSVISGAGTLTGTGTINVTRIAATPSLAGQYTITNKTLSGLTTDYNGAGAQTVSAADYGNLTISTNGTRTVTFVSGGTIRVSGVFSPTATTTSYVVTSNTFEYNGSVDQTIEAFTYNDLVVSNAGNKNILTATGVTCRTLVINDTAVVNIQGTGTLTTTL
jgi:hypothetical protein